MSSGDGVLERYRGPDVEAHQPAAALRALDQLEHLVAADRLVGQPAHADAHGERPRNVPAVARGVVVVVRGAGARGRKEREDDGWREATHQAFGSSTSTPPMYGWSAGGIFTLPSACWCCSRIATSVRPVARPEPFRVWSSRGFFMPSAL